MDCENKKRKYFDKLKKSSLLELRKKNIGGLDIQNDNLSCESHHQYVESNLKVELGDFLAKIRHYNKVHPSYYITKHGLRNINRGLHQRIIRSNTLNRNHLINANETSVIKNIENVISFIKPQQGLINSWEDTKMKIGPPIANSTTKYQQTKNVPIFQKRNDKPIVACQINNHVMAEKPPIQYKPNLISNFTSSSEFSSLENIKTSNKRILPSILTDQKLNKNKSISVENSIQFNSIGCLYKQFVNSHCDEIERTSKNVYSNNDYTISKIKQMQKFLLKDQNKQAANNTNLMNSTEPVINDDNFMDSFTNISSTANISDDFIFKPFTNISNNQDISQFSQDSFICSNTTGLNNDNQAKLELNNEWFSSPDNSKSENRNDNQYHRQIAYYQLSSSNFNSSNSYSDDSFK